MNKLTKLLLTSLTLLVLPACGGGGGGGSVPIIGPLTITGASGNQVSLDGSWSAGCQLDEDGDMEEEVTTISGSSFSITGNSWSGAGDCSGSPAMTRYKSGTFTFGDEVTVLLNGFPVTATKVDIAVTTALFTVYDADWVVYFNTTGLCGATDWVVGTAKEVVGTDCVPALLKDIMYIDDTVDPDIMYDGIDEEEGGTLDANGYPTVLDADSAEARLSGSLTITGASGNQVSLDGSWSAGCQLDEDGDMEEEVTTISGSSFSITANIWEGAGDCSGSPAMTFNMSGTWALGDEMTVQLSGSLVSATKVDIAVTTALITVYDADWVVYFNATGFCSATDWVVGTAKEVVGTNCIPALLKDIMYIDDTVDPDIMYDGIDEEEGGTLDANGYPTVVEVGSAQARL